MDCLELNLNMVMNSNNNMSDNMLFAHILYGIVILGEIECYWSVCMEYSDFVRTFEESENWEPLLVFYQNKIFYM